MAIGSFSLRLAVCPEAGEVANKFKRQLRSERAAAVVERGRCFSRTDRQFTLKEHGTSVELLRHFVDTDGRGVPTGEDCPFDGAWPSSFWQRGRMDVHGGHGVAWVDGQARWVTSRNHQIHPKFFQAYEVLSLHRPPGNFHPGAALKIGPTAGNGPPRGPGAKDRNDVMASFSQGKWHLNERFAADEPNSHRPILSGPPATSA